MLSLFYLTTLASLLSTAVAQLDPSVHVGPLTSRAVKAAVKICNVLNYGAVADGTTDIGPALTKAFAACKAGGNIYIPAGSYAIQTWVSFSGGNAFSIQLEGTISRTGTTTPTGNAMWSITGANDFELYSNTSKGAIQGNGYQAHAQGKLGPHIISIGSSSYLSVHDIILVDAPQFHLFMSDVTGTEVYNMIVVGGNEGGLDGIDASGSNVYVHDVEVTNNKDECVTVKSPAKNFLIENVYCNWSGGCAIGSLSGSTSVANIHYNNIYTQQANQMMMIKSNGGDGTVSNVVFSNFIGHSNAYSLDINGYWTERTADPGNGVTFTDITITNWTGTAANGAQRGPINIICPSGAPCTDITIDDFAIWTDTGSSEWYKCASAYGTGGCLKAGTGGSYATVTETINSAPTGYSAARMPNDLKTALSITASIPIPTAIPTSFFPGQTPASKLLGDS